MQKYVLCCHILLLSIKYVRDQTLESYFNECFGSGSSMEAAKMIRSVLADRALSLRTRPTGLELVKRLTPFTCIQGIHIEIEPQLQQVTLSILNAYVVRRYDSVYVAIELASVSIPMNDSKPFRADLRINREQLIGGPIFMTLEHDVPRGLNQVVFLHLHIVVTPIYACQLEQLSTVPGLFKEHENTTQMETSGTTVVCISTGLVCDGFPNCPMFNGLTFADETATECAAVDAAPSKYGFIWVVFIFMLPGLCTTILLTLWLYRGRWHCYCRFNFSKQTSEFPMNTDSVELTNGASQSYTDITSCVSADVHRNVIFMGTSELTTSCPPPPTYQEILEQHDRNVIGPPNPHHVDFSQTLPATLAPSSLVNTDIMSWISGTRQRVVSFSLSRIDHLPSYNQCLSHTTTRDKVGRAQRKMTITKEAMII
ncbi:hypothetical protein PHET_04387 [Paragonimus heterotremus]|uniref:Uncharacterized protein n=1 Tax=Paragonimus heterotremus TaxID=100268 RepID=A0A8J4SNE3_9TREM|nr:hypothetical protein PHET_04387 [Paragonimus heterotremus]